MTWSTSTEHSVTLISPLHYPRSNWKENILRSSGYFACSADIYEEMIKNYIENHGQKDSGQLWEEL